jgi:hypothetical protein
MVTKASWPATRTVAAFYPVDHREQGVRVGGQGLQQPVGGVVQPAPVGALAAPAGAGLMAAAPVHPVLGVPRRAADR